MSEPEDFDDSSDLGGLLDVLSSPIDDGDAELTAVLTRRPRTKLPSLTLVLAAVVVASAGFLGGAVVGKHYGTSGSGNLAAAFRGLAAARATSSASAGTGTGARSGVTGGAAGGGLFGRGNATIGTIKLIDGATVYV